MSTAIPTQSLKKCDVVMKGGITSGIVYPGLICKLAERYQFQSIGGTSAGAIAAALTAAAEYARRKGHDAFSKVAEVPGWLGHGSEFAAGSNLLNLFQPQRKLRVLFRLATAFLVQGWLQRALRCAQALWFEILLGLLPSLVFLYVIPSVTPLVRWCVGCSTRSFCDHCWNRLRQHAGNSHSGQTTIQPPLRLVYRIRKARRRSTDIVNCLAEREAEHHDRHACRTSSYLWRSQKFRNHAQGDFDLSDFWPALYVTV